MDYLENIIVGELQEILAEVDEKKPVQRVLAGIAYKDGVEQQTIAERHDVHPNTVRNWLIRLERLDSEPFEEVVYDDPRPGQSRELDEAEHDRFIEVLHDSPEEVGLDTRAWTVPLAQQYLEDEFNIEYCRRHVRRLMSEAGLSWKTARPEYAEADERAQNAFRKGFKKGRTIWTTTTQS
jgi:transposase